MKKVRRQSENDLENIRGVFIDKSNKEDFDLRYTFLVKRRNKKAEGLINSLAHRPPFTKYGIRPEIVFSHTKPEKNPKWEYSWISPHLPPKPYSEQEYPFIAADIALSKEERALADAYL